MLGEKQGGGCFDGMFPSMGSRLEKFLDEREWAGVFSVVEDKLEWSNPYRNRTDAENSEGPTVAILFKTCNAVP